MSTPFNERYTSRVQVSGRALVGVMLATSAGEPAGTGLRGDNIAVTNPAPGKVCIRATTQDGTYSAENTYAGPANRAIATVQLDWPTQYEGKLKEVLLREVAVLASLGPCDTKSDVTPVLLGPGANHDDLQVIVNTHGRPVTAALRDPETLRLVRRANCLRIGSGSRVAFDARCDFGTLANYPARLLLRLDETSVDGTQSEPVDSVTLWLAH